MSKPLWVVIILTISLVTIIHLNGEPKPVSQIKPSEEQQSKDATSKNNENEPVSLEKKIGQLFIIGHWADKPVASTTELIKKYNLGGVIIMGNPDKAEETKKWVDVWQEAVKSPLIIAVDQEGGEVSRYKGEDFTQTSQREINDPATAYEVGYTRGKELSELGINVNFAPVLDSANNPESFMYKRVFADRSASADLAANMIKGMQASGVTGVIKHFPGHDDTSDDSHLLLPVVDIDRNELANFVFPFKEIIENNQPQAIMSAHVLFPKIDSKLATISKFFLTDYLRNQLNFNGVIVTDDMSMNAITANRNSHTATAEAISAGADVVLFAAEPHLVEEAYQAIEQAMANGDLPEARINESYDRVMSLKRELP